MFDTLLLRQVPGDDEAVTAELDNPPTIGDLLSCSRYVQEDADLSLLATALDVLDDEFDQVLHKYKTPQGQALQLMKIWLKVKGELASKRELADVLGNAGLGKQVVDM